MTQRDNQAVRAAELLQILVDEMEIRRTLTRYGFAVDSGDAEATGALYTEDSVTTLDGGRLVLSGRQAIVQMVHSKEHQDVLPMSTHMIGPVVVEVSGDEAIAVGYSRLDVADDDGVRGLRTSANRWRLVRHRDTWLIAERETRRIGDADAQALLHCGLRRRLS